MTAPARTVSRNVGIFAGLVPGGLLVAGLVGYAAAIELATPLLSLKGPADLAADSIVVLGGDGPSRAFKAAQMWREGSARHVLVSGDGDCLYIREGMVAAGVPADAIQVECLSGTTWNNAAYSAPMLAATGTESAMLVTSWFHMRRAMARFREVCPNIRWSPAPTVPTPFWETATGPNGPAIVKEYPKVLAYAVRSLIEQLFTPASTIAGPCLAKGGAL